MNAAIGIMIINAQYMLATPILAFSAFFKSYDFFDNSSPRLFIIGLFRKEVNFYLVSPLLMNYLFQSWGFIYLKTTAARAPPAKFPTRNTQSICPLLNPIRVIPRATAGLNTPPDIGPTA